MWLFTYLVYGGSILIKSLTVNIKMKDDETLFPVALFTFAKSFFLNPAVTVSFFDEICSKLFTNVTNRFLLPF